MVALFWESVGISNSLNKTTEALEVLITNGMSTSSINPFNNSYIQSILSSALQSAGVSNTSTSGTSSSQTTDSGQLSPFAQMLSTLQQLQQSNPTEYQQVTSQIASNLQSAAQTASSQGNTSAANELNQLATDFTNASQSGQLPNISDLAQALGSGGHHHHHHGGVGSSEDSSSSSSTSGSSSSSTSSSASSSASSSISALLAAFESNSTQNDSLNPLAIIMNTLSSVSLGSSTRE